MKSSYKFYSKHSSNIKNLCYFMYLKNYRKHLNNSFKKKNHLLRLTFIYNWEKKREKKYKNRFTRSRKKGTCIPKISIFRKKHWEKCFIFMKNCSSWDTFFQDLWEEQTWNFGSRMGILRCTLTREFLITSIIHLSCIMNFL